MMTWIKRRRFGCLFIENFFYRGIRAKVNCYKVIKGSRQQVADTTQRPGGLELLRKSFKICKNFIGAGILEGWLQIAFVYTAMTNYPTPSNFLNPMPAFPVKEICLCFMGLWEFRCARIYLHT